MSSTHNSRNDHSRDTDRPRHHRHNPPLADLEQSSARARRLNLSNQIGKTQLIPGAVAAVGKRGRGAGFYCEDCDLTFKDNVQLVEHYNSKQHLIAIGESGQVRKAGIDEVRARLKALWRKKLEEEKERELNGVVTMEDEGGRKRVVVKVDLQKRLEIARQKDMEEMERKRQARREKRQRRRQNQQGIAA